MISAATTLTVLVGLFLLGTKWTIELVRDWPRKSPMSSYFEQQRSMRNSGDSKAMTKDSFSSLKEAQNSPQTQGRLGGMLALLKHIYTPGKRERAWDWTNS